MAGVCAVAVIAGMAIPGLAGAANAPDRLAGRHAGAVNQATTSFAPFTRIYGQTADATATQELAHQFTYQSGKCPGVTGTRSVVLATDATYPDALASAYLARYLGTGTLLTPTGSLNPVTTTAIKDEGITHVYVVGGPLAVSTAVENDLKSLPAYSCGGASPLSTAKLVQVTRISGQTEYTTAEDIATFVPQTHDASLDVSGAYSGTNSTGGVGKYNTTAGQGATSPSGSGALRTAIVATAAGFQDAEAASTLAYAEDLPILLTTPSVLSAQVSAAISNLSIRQVIVMGGQLAVSNAVVTSLEALGVSVLRIAGTDYTDTAAELAGFETTASPTGLGWKGTGSLTVARGTFFTDGLAGAVVAADGPTSASPQPLVLTLSPMTVGTGLANLLKQAGTTGLGGTKVTSLTILGGSLAITQTVVNAMAGDLASGQSSSTPVPPTTTAPSPPQSISVSAVTSASAIISWKPPGTNPPGGSYVVTGVPGCNPGTSTSCVASGLAPYSNYTPCVSMIVGGTSSPPACGQVFTTLPTDLGDVLLTGQAIGQGQALFSPAGTYFAVLQYDGNFAVYRYTTSDLGRVAQWATGTAGTPATALFMQTDGNLVLYEPGGTPLWSSATALSAHDYLTMQNDGNLVVYSSAGVPLWSSGGGRTSYQGDQLPAAFQLNAGQALYSPTGTYEAVMQGDGNFVVYQVGGAALWSSATSGSGSTHVVMQTDGNLVIYTASGVAVWSSGTAPSSNDNLTMQDDSNLVIYDGSGTALWDRQTGILKHTVTKGQEIVGLAAAQDKPGVAYCWDGGTTTGPSHGEGDLGGLAPGCTSTSTVGFDCTGLTLYAVYQATGILLPHDGKQAETPGGTIISTPTTLKPGDLVFFGGSIDTFLHSGIYAGTKKVWSANTIPGTGVQLTPMSWFEATPGMQFVGGDRFW